MYYVLCTINEWETMRNEKRLVIDPEETSLVIDALRAYKVKVNAQGCYVEGARCEILMMRITNGFHRKNTYNKKLLEDAVARQNK